VFWWLFNDCICIQFAFVPGFKGTYALQATDVPSYQAMATDLQQAQASAKADASKQGGQVSADKRKKAEAMLLKRLSKC
jgi:hypothetical protein